MKTTNRLSVAAAFLLSAALALSCSQVEELEVIEPETPVDEEQVETDAPAVDEGELVPMSFSVTDTKTYVDGKTVKWEEGESIAVYDGFAVREFTMTSLEKLTFEGKIAENSTWQWAVYPYSADGITATESTVTVSLTPDQKLGAQNVAPGLLLSAGKISDGGVVLKNLTALVSVEVTKSDIASVVVEGEAVAGTATFSEDGTLASVAEGSSASAVLKPASDAFAAGTYYVAVLPGLSESDVKVSVVREDGYEGTKTVAALQLLRNKIYSAGQLDKTVEEWVYEVPDAAALLKWHSGHNKDWSDGVKNNYPEDNHKVLLTGDIDLGSEANKWEWKDLYCEFDGNGHRIYNVVIERDAHVHFFEQVYADIHDVTFGSKDGQTYDGVSKIVSTYKAGADVWQYIGLFQRASSSGLTVKNVVSYVPVTVPADANGKFRAAGLICLGTTGGDRTTTIEGCKTYGKVSILHTGVIKNEKGDDQVNYISGMVGLMDGTANYTNTLKITNCENHADIDVHNPSVEAIGGVFGYRFSKKYMYLTIDGCKNYGNITYSCNTEGLRCAVGGVVGKVVETSAITDTDGKYYVNITNCENGEKGVKPSVVSNGVLYCVGGVAGWINGVSMTGCKNYGSVSAADQVRLEDKTKSNVAGGVAGNVASAASNDTASNSDKLTVLNNCRNEGSVSAVFNTISTGGNNGLSGGAVGGVAGSLRSIAEFKDNDNVGDVTGVNAYASKYVFVGGIAGHSHCVNDENSFYGCRNAGTIKAGGTSSGTVNVGLGGIVGKLQAKIYSCANYGAIIRENAANSNAGSVVGMTRASATVKDCIASGTVDGAAATEAVKDKTGATVEGITVGGDRPLDL
jgi:hypothetical protein